MKNMYLILIVLFLFTGCNKEVKKNQNVIIENAIIYYYFDAGFGTSQCNFVIETERGGVFIPKTGFNLSEFTSNGANIQNNVKVTYRLTVDKIDRCFHKEGFLDTPPFLIEIITIEKI